MNSKDFWLSKKLSEKAAILLADLGIDTFEDLVGSIINEDHLIREKNSEMYVTREIVNFRRKLLPTTNTSNKKVNSQAVRILKRIVVNEINWDIKTLNLIRESRSKTLYDLAMISLPVYMNFDNYNFHAYHIIKSKIFEILTEINSTFADAHKNENISLGIFIEKPIDIKNNKLEG